MLIDKKLVAVVHTVLGDTVDLSSPDAGPATLPEWDSVNHLHVILAIESEYGIRFATEDIPELTSLRKIQERLPGE